ncbi:MAG: glycosyltransferase [Synechococcales cyanobacterium C42_A2020_086]|jgi:glycosyltransferase involved in cell wall biosynthesis|nr:glycosyltransferase [Synechococcales cyanobacterium M58_A2018_015]MBF2073836.1 glycosyltransferase [Synechococcales cyanobacterium C42_A2020_086]
MTTTPDYWVSIIINNYNYARFLPQAIDSALAQTYPQVEIIVVDDCSTDESREVIARYVAQSQGRIIPVLHSENGKQAAAFNSGFAASQGEIIIFLDADDYLFPEAVERVVAAWQPGIAKVHYRLSVVDAVGEPLGFSYPQGGKQLATGEVWRTLLQVATYPGVPTSGNALSRRALSQVLPIAPDYKTTADDYLSVLIPFYGDVVAIEEPLAAYRIHGNNQWALSSLSSDRLHRFIQHDVMRCALLRQKAQELGHEAPADLDLRFFGRAWSRLASLKLDPERHPVPTDRALPLTAAGIRALWRYSDFKLKRRVLLSLWFLWVGLLPLPLAKPAITWLLAPQQRPRSWRWSSKTRSAVS